MRIVMRIRVTTRADLFEKRKQQHIERGYGIEDERPIPVNGFCSFVAVRETSAADSHGELVAQAINGKAVLTVIVRCAMSLRIRFRFDGKCILHPRYDPGRDGRPQHGNCEGCESLHVINLYIRITNRRATEGKGIVVRTLTHPDEQRGVDENAPP